MDNSCRKRSKASNSSLDHRGRQAFERLVEQQHAHVPGQGARDRDHLLFASGQKIRRRIDARAQARKELEDPCVRPRNTFAFAPLEPAELEIMTHAHPGKETATLRHIADAAARIGRGGTPREIVAREQDAAALRR